jgi:hypothetical protein
MRQVECKAMMTERPRLSLSQQCQLLSISQSSFYYAPKGESLALMRRIDELFLRYPCFGSRQMTPAPPRGRDGWAAARPPADAAHGPGSDLPGSPDQRAAPGAPGLPLSAAERRHRSPRPGLVRRCHLHPSASRITSVNRCARSSYDHAAICLKYSDDGRSRPCNAPCP